jgi:hypothetical protein
LIIKPFYRWYGRVGLGRYEGLGDESSLLDDEGGMMADVEPIKKLS